MPQLLAGIVTFRVLFPAIDGPPNGPAGDRVSMILQGATGTKRRPVEDPVVPVSLTVKVWPPAVIVPLRAAPVLAETE